MNHHSQEEKTTTSMAVIAIVAAPVLLGVVVITVAVTIPLQQQAEAAGCESGFLHGSGFFAFNASQGRCFGH
jgi:dihydrodipicolinate synthase/N-acetylneuraminate lyase